jgi:predicted DNA-binding protein
MTRITISLPVDVAARLDAEVRATDRTVSAIVRRALRASLPDENDLSISRSDGSAVAHAAQPPMAPPGCSVAMPGPPPAAGPSSSGTRPGGDFTRRSRMSDLHQNVLDRQAALARERAAEAQRQLEDVSKRNAEYFERLENGEESQ